MKVLIWPAGAENDGTAQYRLLMPSWALHEQGADVSVTWTGPKIVWDRRWSGDQPPPDARVLGLKTAPTADVVVLQRPALRWWADIIPHLQREGVAVVVDVDDLFSQLDHGHIATEAMRGGLGAHHHFEFVAEACRLADLVTCSTPRLLEEYGFGHGVVLPNMVPSYYLGIAGSGRARVGWSGTTETHPKDLPVVGTAVRDALRAHGWGFHVIGTGKGVKKALWLPDEPTVTDWVPFAEYAYELANLAIGIVPLARTPFNAAKSALKMAEMASVGVPCIGSPTPDNLRLHELGVGLIARNPEEWFRHLSALMESREYQRELAERGREVMAEQTYEKQCHRWWDAWATAGLNRMSRRMAARLQPA